MSDTKPGTAMTPAESSPRNDGMTIVRDGDMLAAWDNQQSMQRQSFDAATPQGREDMIRCKGVPDFTGLALAGRDLNVRDWMMHVVELEDQETGEVYKTLRLVLICADGTIGSTTSPSLIRGWSDVVGAWGKTTFGPPLTVRIKAVASRKKGQYLLLESVKSPLPADTHKGRK